MDAMSSMSSGLRISVIQPRRKVNAKDGEYLTRPKDTRLINARLLFPGFNRPCRRSIDKFVKTYYVKSLNKKSKTWYFAHPSTTSNSFLLLDKKEKEKQNECK